MRVLGLDPGLATTGYGVVDHIHSRYTAIDWGIIATAKELPLPQRLFLIRNDLITLLKKYKPDVAVVESIYFEKNAKTAIAVAQARGVILATLQERRVKIIELTPLQLKSRIASSGRAPKGQVQYMVKALLKLSTIPKPDDAADALALALSANLR